MKLRTFFFVLLTFLLFSCQRVKINIPVVVEIIDSNGKFSSDTLTQFLRENDFNTSAVYQWQNHWVVFDEKIDGKLLASKLIEKFPELKVKTYEKPFYNFNRQKITGEKPADEWENIILTANLVADTTLQRQYMEYHRTQFEKFPEVSKGFCNADFQQLLVYRNGRQLMLVISIPKGKTLEELNPKTTENNPRVDEWNALMSKYQEGIEGAPENVVWVFLKKMK